MKRFYPALVVMLLTAGMMSQSSPTPAASNPGTTSPQSPATAGAPTAQQDQPAQASPSANSGDNSQSDDPLLDVPPLPKAKVTLVGGTVHSIDQIRNRMTVDTFGGGHMKFIWDERSHIYRDGVETTQLAIKKGDRVYVDSQLVGPKIFAKNIRVVTQLTPADADGQVLGFEKGMIVMRDRLSSQAIRFRVTPDTKIVRENQTAGSQADLRAGTLVNVAFSPDKANRGVAQSVKVLAVPGESFRFSGKITHLDMKSGTLSIANDADNITYDLAIDSANVAGRDELGVGAEVNVVATFQGDNYLAQQITVTQAASKEDKDKDKKDKKDKDKKDQASDDDDH